MPSKRPGPKTAHPPLLDLSALPAEHPDRAFALLSQLGITPYRWQAEELAVLVDPATRPALGYIQVARKNGKTGLGTFVALCELLLGEDRHIYAVSDSERNLSSVLWLELTSLVRRAGIDDSLLIYQSRIECPQTGSFIQMRPGNFAASQGINPHLVIADEVHLIPREVWDGYLMATAARTDALVLGLTTPGYSLESAAHELYLEAMQGDSELYARIYEPSDPGCAVDDEGAWAESNPALEEVPGLRASLARDAKRTPENTFRRFRLGQWTATESAWLPYGAFDACRVEHPIEAGETVWLGLDGSWSGDTTGLVACSTSLQLQVVGHWRPGPFSGDGWRVPMDVVEQAIRDACARWDVVEVVCDPARWARNIQSLAAEGLPMVEYPQSTQRMIPATLTFAEDVLGQRLTWSAEGGDALAAHVAAAEVKLSEQGAMIRKPAFAPAAANIDLAVAAVMAHDRASRATEPVDLELSWISI